jgi:hypothetical protein
VKRLACPLVVCFWLCAGAPIGAQAPAPARNLAVSYSFIQLAEDDYAVPLGWAVSFGGNVNSLVSPIVEFGGNYRPDGRYTLELYTLQAGVRITPVRNRRVRPFGEIVGGMIAAGCCSETDLRLMLEPGGGIDVPVSDRVSVQVAASFPIILAAGGGAQLVRVRAGVAVALGKR